MVQLNFLTPMDIEIQVAEQVCDEVNVWLCNIVSDLFIYCIVMIE